MGKDDERRERNKIRDRLCNCLGQKEEQYVISPSFAPLNSSFKSTTDNDVKSIPSGLVCEKMASLFHSAFQLIFLLLRECAKRFYLLVLVEWNVFTLSAVKDNQLVAGSEISLI